MNFCGIQFQNTIGHAVSAAAAGSGIEKPYPIQKFAVWDMGMPVQHDLCTAFAGFLREPVKPVFNAEQVTVGEQSPMTAELCQNALSGCGGIVTVSGHAVQGELRKSTLQTLSIGEMISQMTDCIGLFQFDGVIHIADRAVGIRKDKYFHINHRQRVCCINWKGN